VEQRAFRRYFAVYFGLGVGDLLLCARQCGAFAVNLLAQVARQVVEAGGEHHPESTQ
jgi:hypothetical protein